MNKEQILKIVQVIGFILAVFLLYRLFTLEQLERPDYIIMALVCTIALILAFLRKRNKD